LTVWSIFDILDRSGGYEFLFAGILFKKIPVIRLCEK